MNKLITDLYAKMNERLQEVKIEVDNPLQLAELSYDVVEQTLMELKRYISSYSFRDKQEEVDFFKNVKPLFQKEQIFFWEVAQIEQYKPPVGKEDIISHYLLGAKRVDFYFKRHNDLYNYYRKNSTDQDEHYFLRTEAINGVASGISKSDLDPAFNTECSFEFAKVQAYEKFGNYVYLQIFQLEHPEMEQVAKTGKKSRLVWTDSKADLVELAYGIQARGSITHGKAEIKDIIAALELVFSVNVGNFYRTFQNLRIRKKNRTPYWDAAKQELLKSMDNTDLAYS